MISWVKSLFKDSLLYGIGIAVSRFLQIFILPIVAKSLTLSEFGYYSNYIIFYSILGGFFILGLDSAVARYYYESEDFDYRKRLYTTSFITVTAISVSAVYIFSFLKNNFLKIIAVPSEYGDAFIYVLMAIPFMVINNYYLCWFKWKRQIVYFLINSVGSVLLLLPPLLFTSHITISFLFKIILFSQGIIAIISFMLSLPYFTLKFDTKLLWILIRYGFPWTLVYIFSISSTYLDRIFLNNYISPDLYGIFNFSVRISAIIALVTMAFEMAFGPLAFSIWNKQAAPRFFARLQSIYILFISAIACFICIFSTILVKLLGSNKYEGAEKVFPLLLFSTILLSLINFSNLGIIYAKKSFKSSFTLIVGFLFVLLFNILLTPVYLQYGAASASLLGYAILVVTGYYFSHKYYPVPYNFLKDVWIFLLFFVLSLISVNIRLLDNNYIDILGKALILCLIIFFIFNFYFKKELEKVKSYFKINQSAYNDFR